MDNVTIAEDGAVRVEIPMKLPGLNEYVRACRTNAYIGSKMKKDVERWLLFYFRDVPEFGHPVRISFLWIEENKRRDLDNVAFAKKFVLDALVKAGKLKDDNRRCVTAFDDSFDYADEAAVILTIREDKGDNDKR